MRRVRAEGGRAEGPPTGGEEGFMPGYIFKVRIWKPRSSHVRALDWSLATAMLLVRRTWDFWASFLTQGTQSRAEKILS